MIDRNISVHLQDFPNLNFIENNESLVENMDFIRMVCSSALSIRDQKNLRVRLPLQKLTIIGKNLQEIAKFSEIIKDEVNVKSVEIQENLDDLAELNLKINFKKIGAKYGPKIKEIMAAAKSGNFTKIADNEIEIAGINLVDDEFDLALTPKTNEESSAVTVALPDNSSLISLETKITEDLANEGIARDIIRAVQQARKDADLDVSDKILLQISAEKNITDAAQSFENYIKEQVLADDLKISYDAKKIEESCFYSLETKIEDGKIKIGINKK